MTKRKPKFRVGQRVRIYPYKDSGIVKLIERIAGGFLYRTAHGIEGPAPDSSLRPLTAREQGPSAAGRRKK